jgi:hypothetical protein
VSGAGDASDSFTSRFLAVLILGHWDARYPTWAWLGVTHPPAEVWDELNPDAVAAVRRFRLTLLHRFVADRRLGSEEIEPVAAAVNACGGWWPMPESGDRWTVREPGGLDVPAVWGLEALRRHLRPEMVDARDQLKDRDRALNIAKTLAAAGDLLDVLRAAIGGRYAHLQPKPTAAMIERAWKRFDTARARTGGMTVLPLFGVRTVWCER